MEPNWNYEKDLELVKQKLATCSPSEKHKIQKLIGEILDAPVSGVEPPRKLISETEGYSKDYQGQPECVPLTPDSLDLDPSLILNVIRLMHQFKKDFQGTRKLLEDTEIKNTVASKLFQATSWAQLKNVWEFFSVYVQKTVGSKASNTFQPKCPLKVDVILEQIFGYLPRKDLLNCRLVSRAWNQKLTQWKFPKRRECALTLSFDILGPILESNITSPFIFSNLNVTLDGVAMDRCNWFFTKYGSYVKTLRLYAERLEKRTKHDRYQTSSLFELTSNLRTIFQNVNQVQHLRIISIPETVLQQPFFFSTQELKTFTLPAVQSLTLYLTCDFSTKFSKGFFSMLHNVKSLHLLIKKPTNELQHVLDGIQKMNLRSLTMNGSYSRANFWTSLQTQNLKMLKTDISLVTEEDVASFEEFVQSQSLTLETFTCTNVRMNQTLRTAQVSNILQNLETLAFEFAGMSPFDPITPEQVPRLRSTTFKFSEVAKCFENSSFEAVQELNNGRCRVGLSTAGWKSLGSRFPNVNRLSVHLWYELGGSSASDVFRCFRNLEYLDLGVSIEDNNNDINLLLSGFTPERVSVLSELLVILKSPEELLKIKPPHASLRDLKKLKELRLELSGDWDDETGGVINDVGIRLGLMSIQPLDQLSIVGDFTIAEDGAAMLTKYHRNVIFDPTTP